RGTDSVPVWLGCGWPANTNTHRAHDPHTQNSLYSEPSRNTAPSVNSHHHGAGYLYPYGAVSLLLQARGLTASVFRFLAPDFAHIHESHPSHERAIHSPLQLAIRKSQVQAINHYCCYCNPRSRTYTLWYR